MKASTLLPSARSRESGFTLLEVLVTILITGIVFAIGISSWQGLIESRRVTAASNQLASDLRLANTTAVSKLGSWRLVLMPGRGNRAAGIDYYMVKMTSGTSPTVDSSVPPVRSYLPDDTRIENVPSLNDTLGISNLYGVISGFSGDSRSIEFDADGSADNLSPAAASGRDTITVTHDGSPTEIITLVEETSRIKVG